MASLNKVLLIGRLTRDPEFKSIPSGAAVAEFGFAVNRYYNLNGELKEDTCFLDITAWGRQGEKARNYLRKGRQAFIEGHLIFDQWETREGQKRSKIRVTATNIQLLEFSNRREGGGVQREPETFGEKPAAPGGDFFPDAAEGGEPEAPF